MIDTLIRELCGLLQSCEGLKGIRFVPEFPGKSMEGPLRVKTVSVGMEAAEIADTGVGRVIGAEMRGCRAEITLDLGIHVPFSVGAQELYAILSTMTDVLLFDGAYALLHLRCGSVSADRNTGAFTLHVSMTFRVDFTRGD